MAQGCLLGVRGRGRDIYPEKLATKLPVSSFFYGHCHMGRHGDISGESLLASLNNAKENKSGKWHG